MPGCPRPGRRPRGARGASEHIAHAWLAVRAWLVLGTDRKGVCKPRGELSPKDLGLLSPALAGVSRRCAQAQDLVFGAEMWFLPGTDLGSAQGPGALRELSPGCSVAFSCQAPAPAAQSDRMAALTSEPVHTSPGQRQLVEGRVGVGVPLLSDCYWALFLETQFLKSVFQFLQMLCF